jgi:predicted DNA binding CopG/RHH family protein
MSDTNKTTESNTATNKANESKSENNATNNKRINLRVDQDTYNAIKKRAFDNGHTISEFLRQMALQGYIIQRNVDELRRLLWEINKIGVNINRIVKLCNEHRFVTASAVKTLEDEHYKVWQLLDGFLDEDKAFKLLEERRDNIVLLPKKYRGRKKKTS